MKYSINCLHLTSVRSFSDRSSRLAGIGRAIGASVLLVAGLAGCGASDGSSDGSSVESSQTLDIQETSSHSSLIIGNSVQDDSQVVEKRASDRAETARSNSREASNSDSGGSTSSGFNSVDEIERDMRLMNEGVLRGVNPAYGFSRGPGYVIMGNDPRGTNTPRWFRPSDHSLRTSKYWEALLPWFVLFEGQENQSYNVRIHLRNMKVWYKSKSDGQWKLLGDANGFDGSNCAQGSNYTGCTGMKDMRAEPDGGMSFRPVSGNNFHGWWTLGRMPIPSADIAAVFVTAQTRLIPLDGSGRDDGRKAAFLIQLGADYYPHKNFLFRSYAAPGVGISRAKYITREWRAVNMLTFSDVGSQEPGGGISLSEVHGAPPPLD